MSGLAKYLPCCDLMKTILGHEEMHSTALYHVNMRLDVGESNRWAAAAFGPFSSPDTITDDLV